MPFKKIAPNRYRSKSGRIWTEKQVKAYFASDGFKKKTRKKKKTVSRKENRKRGSRK